MDQYTKTADVVEKELWNHTKASKWLREWVQSNKTPTPPKSFSTAGESFPFVLGTNNRVHEEMLATPISDPVGWHRYAPLETRVRLVSAQMKEAPKPKSKANAKKTQG